MRKHKYIKIEEFRGTSIVPLHNSEKNNKQVIPYEIVTTQNYLSKEVKQQLNRLEYVPFDRSKRLRDETHRDHLERDWLEFNFKLKDIKAKYKMYDIYTLDNIYKSSQKVYLN